MGRPRSSRAHDAVIVAARTLFAERGLDATSMDAIAAAAGVSKATIYKHWTDKDGLCLEVMAELHGFDSQLPDTDTGDLRADLLAVVGRRPPEEYADVRQRILPHFMAHAARNPTFGNAWRGRVFEPARAQITRALQRAMRRGELPETLNVDFAIGLLQGPPMYWYVRRLTTGTGPDGFAPEMLVDAFIRAQGSTGQATAAVSRAKKRGG
jgi:AcrR family transcriptional regulator